MRKQTVCKGRSPGGALFSGGRHTWRALPTFASTVALAGGTRACSSQTSAARHTGDTLAPGTRTGFSTHEEVGQHPKANAAGGPASKRNTKHNTEGKQHETKHLADGEELPKASKTNGTFSKNEHSVATLAKKRNLQGERERVAVAVGTVAQTSCGQRQPTSANMSICDTRSASFSFPAQTAARASAPLNTKPACSEMDARSEMHVRSEMHALFCSKAPPATPCRCNAHLRFPVCSGSGGRHSCTRSSAREASDTPRPLHAPPLATVTVAGPIRPAPSSGPCAGVNCSTMSLCTMCSSISPAK